VKDAVSKKGVGVLDESFVNEYLREGVAFIARGRVWRTLSVVDEEGERREIVVEPAKEVGAAIPEWIGEEIPVSREVCEQVAGLLAAASEEELAQEFFCDSGAIKKIVEFEGEQKKFFLPDAKEIVLEQNKDFVVVHCFAGNRVNETLARALSALLASSLGSSVLVKPSAYGFLLEFAGKSSGEKVKQVLIELSGRKLDSILRQTLPQTALFRKKLIGVAKAFGVISKKSELGGFGARRLAEALYATPVFEEALQEVFFDKLDLKQASEALGKKIVLLPEAGKWSPLARQFFEYGAFSELMAPSAPDSKIVQAFKENLLEKRVELLCTYCAKKYYYQLHEDKMVECPYCRSSQTTLEEYREVFEKQRKRRQLNSLERRKLSEMRRCTSLIASYGRRALLALSTFGVGPHNAARVLARLHEDDDKLCADLLEAQKQFIKTKQYWRN
jgi:ATP-dependent Lhr-like helicase